MQWVAHKGWQERGAKANSREALEDALLTDFRVEFDLIFTKGQLLVAHSKDDVNERTITLEEALEILLPGENELTLDLKNKGGEKLLTEIIKNIKDRVIVSSHYLDSLMLVDAQRGWSLPSLPYLEIKEALQTTTPDKVQFFMLHYSLVTPENVAAIKEWGGSVCAWTIDNPKDLYLKVEQITSNCPEKMRAAAKSVKPLCKEKEPRRALFPENQHQKQNNN